MTGIGGALLGLGVLLALADRHRYRGQHFLR